ncbi:protein enabled homolog isoform X2 [Siniperca chuatsi]|uniref:protein enabled homolog isoform X2 n=1 Tax=Siniperca chuatsi TaxID=119488 RepID=UPI001CE08826|nr:protein enabled homolog isoform X2 [Siniperca chuatsi]
MTFRQNSRVYMFVGVGMVFLPDSWLWSTHTLAGNQLITAPGLHTYLPTHPPAVNLLRLSSHSSPDCCSTSVEDTPQDRPPPTPPPLTPTKPPLPPFHLPPLDSLY